MKFSQGHREYYGSGTGLVNPIPSECDEHGAMQGYCSPTPLRRIHQRPIHADVPATALTHHTFAKEDRQAPQLPRVPTRTPTLALLLLALLVPSQPEP